ncbi:hypothetical protein COU54_00050 [Candidatus Pacearchaeota archaeon CG10_big_fil_rev_8_21_14_0_10_31_24]|nr:MAG: hypothetical protein COU54_00050 [Candidatus Pacearchaeota archaeon CG10_big_fil_rev_8_21_14_0_10_31_24]
MGDDNKKEPEHNIKSVKVIESNIKIKEVEKDKPETKLEKIANEPSFVNEISSAPKVTEIDTNAISTRSLASLQESAPATVKQRGEFSAYEVQKREEAIKGYTSQPTPTSLLTSDKTFQQSGNLRETPELQQSRKINPEKDYSFNIKSENVKVKTRKPWEG